MRFKISKMSNHKILWNNNEKYSLHIREAIVYTSIVYLMYLAYSYYDLNKLKITVDLFSLFIHIYLSGIAISIYFFIDKKHKKIALFSILLSVISIHNVVIIDHYANTPKEAYESKISYSLFTFARSLYYYFLINIVLIYFNITKFEFIKFIYHAFTLFSLIYVTLVFNNAISDQVYFSIKKSIHYISYILKPFPYIISSFYILKEIKDKKKIFNIIFFIFSIFCFFSIIFTMYFYKHLQIHFYHFTQINSVIFLLYIVQILIGVIFNEKRENERIKKEYVYSLREKLHELKNEVSYFYNKFEEINKNKAEKILIKIMEINKNVSIEDEVYLSRVETKKYLNTILDDYQYNFEYEKINFKFNLNEDSKLIYIDKDKTEIIINNLILNAIDHQKIIGKFEPIVLNIYTTKSGFWIFKNKYLYFEIENTGSIPQEFNNIIYEKGFTTKDKLAYNAGIGLYHAKKVALKLGGFLSHISKNGRTKFILKLPQKN